MGWHKGECPYLDGLVGIESVTQVLFAWRFRLVVKLTAPHLPFTHRYCIQSYSFWFTMCDIRADPLVAICISSNSSVHNREYMHTVTVLSVTVTCRRFSHKGIVVSTISQKANVTALASRLESFYPFGVARKGNTQKVTWCTSISNRQP